jgi:L-fuconolactonase
MHGIRFLFNEPARIQPHLDGIFDEVHPVLEENGVAVALLVPNHLHVAADIAARHPGLKIIVDHLGVPRGSSGPDAFSHLLELLALARFPNISVKAAGVGDYATEGYPFPSLDAPLRRIFAAFGPRRIVWASELSRLRHPYRQSVTHFTEELDFLSEADRGLIMGGNICRIVGWGMPSSGKQDLRRTGAG